MSVRVKILNPLLGSALQLPKRATRGSAGIDLTACIQESVIIYPNQVSLFHSGIAVDLDEGMTGLLLPRSGIGVNEGIVLANLTGVIDSDYKQEIIIPLWNRSETRYTVYPGERICQIIFIPIYTDDISFIDTIENNNRGGFGSTGK